MRSTDEREEYGSGSSSPSGTANAPPTLAYEPHILERFADEFQRCGVVGETKIGKLLYLALTSRFLPRPVSVAVKGPSSSGKSFTTVQVLRFFPLSAYLTFTAMSEKVLVYTNADLRHRFIVLFEADGMGSMASYLMRSLLSEGKILYEVTEKTEKGFVPRRIEKEGPTGLLVTTTDVNLHPENETRLISVTVTDTPEQTRAVFLALATKHHTVMDLTPWIELQEWLENANHAVCIPYAITLANLVPTTATRLRRDFGKILDLIQAHAILHQALRQRDQDGRIIATLEEDYAIVRELIADWMAEGVEAAVQ